MPFPTNDPDAKIEYLITEETTAIFTISTSIALTIEDEACEVYELTIMVDTHKLIEALAEQVPHLLIGVS